MKPISPVADAEQDPGYPLIETTRDQTTSRRDCLRRLVAGAGAGAVLLAAGDALARKSQPIRVVFRLSRRHTLSGCDYVVDRIDLQTRDPRLAAFLKDAREHAGIEASILRVLAAATCRDATDRKRLTALEARVARAATGRFRARRRQRPGALIATLVLSRHRPPVPGGLRPPAQPVPRP